MYRNSDVTIINLCFLNRFPPPPQPLKPKKKKKKHNAHKKNHIIFDAASTTIDNQTRLPYKMNIHLILKNADDGEIEEE